MNRLILEILHVLFKHKFIILGAFIAIFGAVTLGLIFRSDTYRTPGRIMITGQRAYFRLTAGEGRQPPLDPDIRAINTEIETIKSTAFLNKVVTSLPFSLLDEAEEEKWSTQREENRGVFSQAVGFFYNSAKLIANIPSAIGRVISLIFTSKTASVNEIEENGTTNTVSRPNPGLSVLRSGLSVTAVPNSTLVEVAYTDKNPQRAAAVVNAILEAYPLHQASLYQDPIALAFYDKQREQLGQEITNLEAQLRNFESQENLVEFDEQKKQTLDLLEKIKDRLKGADLDIEQGIGKIAELEKQIPLQPVTIVQGQEAVDTHTRLFQERLTKLEIDKNELLQKYTEKDRRVQDKETEIAALREKLNSSTNTKIIVGERVALNPIRQDMLRELSEQKVKLGQLRPKRETLARQVNELNTELTALNSKSYELIRMQEALANKKEVYALYNKKAEEARISGAMDRDNLVNVKVTDRAPIPRDPVPNNATILLMLAAVVGLSAGVGGALALEYTRPTFHSEIDVERHLQLPVLALIPDFREEA